MKEEAKLAIEHARSQVDNIIKNVKRADKRDGLAKVNLACIKIVKEREEMPTYGEILRELKGISYDSYPKKTTLKNNRPGGNDYRKIIDIWKIAAMVVVEARQCRTVRAKAPRFDLTDADVLAIEDDTLQLKVAMCLRKVSSLKNQLDLQNRLGGKPIIRHSVEKKDSNGTPSYELDDQELKALFSLLDGTTLNMRGFSWSDEGALVDVSGTIVAKPGFKTLLEKIAGTVDRGLLQDL